VIDFAALPPEINSGLMYVGPGSGPMLAASVAWDTLAAELYSTASSYGNAISDLTSVWLGPSSIAMAAAAAPYVSWMSTTAGQADEISAQAKAAAAAYEAAFAMTVPPSVIAANRALLLMLIATNFFGQNTPAIMATEAQYMQMWAQDAAAMYGYQAAAQAASTFTPFTTPPLTTDPTALGAQGAAVAQAAGTSAGAGVQTVSPLTSSMSTPLSSALSTPLTTAAAPNALPAVTSTTSSVSSSSSSSSLSSWTTLASSSTALTSGTGLASGAGSAAPMSTSGISAIGLAGSLMRPVGPTAGVWNTQWRASGTALVNGFASGAGGFGSPGMGGAAATAGMGRAASVGLLSVPQSWASAAPAFSHVGSVLSAPGDSAAPAVMPGGPGGMPGGMPMLANPMRGMGAPAAPQPRFGFRPFVQQRAVYTG
jgi:PPE-repeat protein